MITQNKCLSRNNDASVFSDFRWVTQYHKNIFASLIYFFKQPKIIILRHGQWLRVTNKVQLGHWRGMPEGRSLAKVLAKLIATQAEESWACQTNVNHSIGVAHVTHYYFKRPELSNAQPTWRITTTLTTAVIAYIVTGQLIMAMIIRGIEFILKFTIYYGHERAWNTVRWFENSWINTIENLGDSKVNHLRGIF